MRAFSSVTPSALLLAAALGTAAPLVQAQSTAPKPEKLGQCVTCHGANGLSMLPNAPHLAGQPAMYLAEQLHQYRSGKRFHEMMSVVSKMLTDQDIAQLSKWYAEIKIQVPEAQ